MAGVAVSTLQTRGLFCFDPATILRLYCLALTFVFLGTIGALAQTVAVNKLPIADAGPDQTVDSGATITLDASASTVPAGRTIIHYQWLRLDNDFGSYVPVEFISSNRPNPVVQDTAPTLPDGIESRTVYYTLWVTDSDGFKSETFSSLTVTVVAPTTPIAPASNKAPEADAGPDQTVASGDRVDLDGSGSTDDDGTVVRYNWRWLESVPEDAPRATLSEFTSVTPWFTAPTLTSGANEISYNLALVVQDNDGTWTDQDKVTVTVAAPIAPPNKAPEADAGSDQTVAAGATVTLASTGSSVDRHRGPIVYTWARTGGTGGAVTLSSTTAASPTFTADMLEAGAEDVTHTFTLTVTDSTGATATDTVEVTITSPFAAPNAVAVTAESEYVSGATVTLASTGSSVDRRRGPISYTWARTGGTGGAVTLSSTTAASPTFTADMLEAGAEDVTHTFTLTVTDSTGATATDTVEVTITSLFADPVARAVITGRHTTVASGETVMLDGTGSTPDRRRTIASYIWTGETAEVTASLTDADMDVATFTAETLTAGAPDVTHTFTLTVTDSAGETATATVKITVTSNAPPVASVVTTTREFSSGTSVEIMGSGTDSDSDDATLVYVWDRTGGTGNDAVVLTGETTATLSFTADTLAPGAADVTHILELVVTDTDGAESDPVEVTITITSPIKAPVANAGLDQEVSSGATVTLASTGSSVDRRRGPISYTWARTGGTGANVTLTGATEAMASFTADMLVAGAENVTHTFTLTVTDSTGASDMDTVEVTVTANALPVATVVTTTREFPSGTSVVLMGSGTDSDSDDTTLAYEWDRTGGTGNSAVVLTGKNTTTLSFTADTLPEGAAAVTHIFEFVVTDTEGAASDPVAVTVTVDAPNAPPVAHASPPPVTSGGQVQLDGRGSMVPGGTIVAWAWSRTGGTPGVTVTLIGADTPQPTVMANDLEPGGPDEIHEFTLIVTDDEGMTSVGATVMVTITAPIAAPVANAGPDQRAVSRATVRLDGRDSTPDRRKTITSYAWERTGGTGDSNLTLTGTNTAQPTFTADTLDPGVDAVTHVFTLTVTDEDGMTSTDTVTVTVVSVDIRLSPSELMVQEGGTGSYQVRLSESPRRELAIMAVSGNEDIVKLNNARLVFDNGNWNEWQEVEINSVAGSSTDDPVVIRHRLVTAGATSPVPGDVTVTLRPRADDPLPRPVGQFLRNRATALINNQPGLSSLLESDGSAPDGSFTFQATDGRLALNGGFVHNSVWGKVSGAYASSESAAGNTGSVTKSVLASFGVHRKYSERFLAGIMLQFDLADHDRAGQVGRTDTIDGTGWLVGPYFATRHGSQPLYFEGRLLYGQSDNDIRFMDTGLGVMRTGSFDTRRLLAQIRVEGEIAMSGRNHGHDEYNGDNGHKNGPRLRPYADARWIEDRAEAFTDNIRNRVPGQSVSIGQLELGSNMEIPIAVRTGAMTLTGGLGLVWSNTEGDYILSDSSAHGRGEIGFSYDPDDNLRIDLDSFYDGIGNSRYEGYGLSLSAEIKF